MLEFNNTIFDKLLDNKSVFFIQIGANNGISSDPIHNLIIKNNWSGILFEPGAHAFAELTETYKNFPNLTLINSAVSNYDGVGNLFCGTTTPHFTLNELKATHMFDVEPTAVEVNILSPKTIVETYDIKNLDLLQIDAEGHDFTIIKAFPFHVVKPSIIRYEYVNLYYDGMEVDECNDFLQQQGYTSYINKDAGDIISILE